MERIRKRLTELREVERQLNVDNGKLDKQISVMIKRKQKIATQISHNMKFRLILKLYYGGEEKI